MKRRSKIALFLFLSAGWMSCLKPEVYPVEPVIEFSKFERYGDTAALFINFTDGDGDIGLEDYQDDPPYDTSSIYYYNLFVRYYEKVNGVFQPGLSVPAGEPIEFNYRIQNITPEGQNKALRGEIRVSLSPSFYNPFSTDSDTIMYKIQLCDRALHMSNVVESGVIIR